VDVYYSCIFFTIYVSVLYISICFSLSHFQSEIDLLVHVFIHLFSDGVVIHSFVSRVVTLAHGLTGILAVLLQCPSFVLTNEVTELIKKSVDYVESVVVKYKGDFPSRGTHCLTITY
jgi:hypothetical protein